LHPQLSLGIDVYRDITETVAEGDDIYSAVRTWLGHHNEAVKVTSSATLDFSVNVQGENKFLHVGRSDGRLLPA
jgi:hypothetical protein